MYKSVLLNSPSTDKTLSLSMSQTLALPGLGKKTVVFPNKRHNYGKLRAKLEEEFRKLQSQHGTFELLPYCKAKLHFFSSRGIHNKKPTAKKKMLTVQQIAYGGNYPLKPCQRIGCKHFDQQFWRQQQSALRSHIGYKLKWRQLLL